ncbi:N-acetylneuraminate synthase family protein [Halorubrum salinarum]|uniref:N-acetylneuraminate synthase family protein n=1 Tax=Halorubrum salinarum TaxID=2739057 RepID=A0A7D4C4R8_9EURY|nr:N-acetylneuraminate synthase family protein [Halorubrum salinarum]QKG92038.1 N-acetylneuraminate synthase family protein [Halorubrum salinarum]
MIEIDSTQIGPDHRPYIIAEVGINAQNDLTLAKRFIEEAADAGADAVKFQTHIADTEMVESEMRSIGAGEVYDTIADCEWSIQEHRELQSHADRHDVTFLSTPFSADAIDILDEIDVPAIKVGSGEMNNRHLLEYAASTGKPLLVSTGMNTIDEIEATCAFLDDVAIEYALFYCVSAYPTTAADFDFKTIEVLEKIANTPVGFSDHSTGVEAAKVAIGNGAALIEKHFTIDRRLPGPDQEVSIEPDELRDICEFATLYNDTSNKKDGLADEEVEIKQWAQHSVVTTETIDKGEELTKKNTTTKRPGTGLSADRYFEFIGQRVTTSINQDTILKPKHIDSD